jgi:hypothetical protein
MFCDCNVLYWAKEEWTYGPDCDFYDALDAARWAGSDDWPELEFSSDIEAREAWLHMNLDTRPLEQRPDARRASFRSPIAPSRRWQTVVDAHRAQELEKWIQRQQQHAGAI